MAKRIIIHFITDCDGAGCERDLTQLADGQQDSAGRVLPRLMADAERAFTEVKVNGTKRTLCPECYEKLKGVFKAALVAAPAQAPAG